MTNIMLISLIGMAAGIGVTLVVVKTIKCLKEWEDSTKNGK